MYAKIKESLGRIKPNSRLPDDEEARTPDEEIDLEEWSSTTSIGLGERLKRSARTFATLGLLGVAIIGILWAWGSQLAIGLFSNVVVQAGTVLLGTFATGLLVGIQHQRGVITRSDWLILSTSEGVTPFLGEFHTSEDGTNVFVPYRGFDFLGDRARPLYLRELGEDVARSHAKKGRNPEDPVRIRVDDGMVQVRDTAYGTVVSVISGGLEVDAFGRYSDVFCTPPEQVTAENYRQLKDQLEMYLQRDLPKLKRENEMLEQQVENLRDRLRQSTDEEINQFIDRLARVQEVSNPHSNGQSGQEQTNGKGTATIKELEDRLEAFE
ncbi:hypothetical protein AArcSl_1658 [Halalkaliarchaeum desulfuricum]|uniref:Uncharacterized protein n=1 Tax=Halalkaliarchaeum desulfuricum TaxID=2055893 RepID=A0A343TJL5_9EURY|nr:hypothetical protein [Halalkaliarchaeum desulfuricum]AUX09287.1 hypothetical protein AArcSl_1658 [Halalkaliarchaeum desulfuricum]